MITLDSHIRLEDTDIDTGLLESMLTKCVGDNPAYSSHQKLIASKPYLQYSKIPVPPKQIKLVQKIGNLYNFPRGLYAELKSLGLNIQDLTVPVGASLPQLKISLRPYQTVAVDTITSQRYGILEAPTGSGKTIMALAIASKLQQKTLFIVHTKSLLKQTVAEVKLKLGVDPGVIGDGQFEIKDFTIAMVQTLLRRDLSAIVASFGLVIFDECHHVPAKTFTTIATSFSCYYMYGLSATIDRSDGTSWVMYNTIGPLLHSVPRKELLDQKAIIKPQILTVCTPYRPAKQFDSFDVALHLNAIVVDDTRNNFIISYIDKVFREHPNIKPVILTDRINHVEMFAQVYKDKNPVVYHGQLNPKIQKINLEKIKNSSGVFTIATYTSIGEGFDVPLWDTLFLATPFSSTTRLIQVLGRISRPAAGKTTAYVHDFVDVYDSVLYSRFEKRKQAYDLL